MKTISKKDIRHKRVRAKISGTKNRPRLSVFRSNKHLFLQLINDMEGKTILGFSDKKLKSAKKKNSKSDIAFKSGQTMAKLAREKNIKEAVFDRGGYKYHGRVKKVAEGAREGGLKL